MKVALRFSLLFFTGILLSSCFTAPEYPIVPAIEFENVIFREGEVSQDSLILTIYFRDGDGDLGLFPDENEDEYRENIYFDRGDNFPITFADRNTPPFDTLPPYEFPYYCLNYQTPDQHGFIDLQQDTLYFQRNENHFNIFVRFFVKKNGQYTEFDWEQDVSQTLCTENFDGRFPVLNDLSGERPLEGSLRYGMVSAGFEPLFRLDTLKLQVWIKDRALNQSNTIETPDFVLRDIQVE